MQNRAVGIGMGAVVRKGAEGLCGGPWGSRWDPKCGRRGQVLRVIARFRLLGEHGHVRVTDVVFALRGCHAQYPGNVPRTMPPVQLMPSTPSARCPQGAQKDHPSPEYCKVVGGARGRWSEHRGGLGDRDMEGRSVLQNGL